MAGREALDLGFPGSNPGGAAKQKGEILKTVYSSDKVEVVFECDKCTKKEKDIISNVAYNGPPMCCEEEMSMSHCEISH